MVRAALAAVRFFARQGAFPQEYFVYFKEMQRSMAENMQAGRVRSDIEQAQKAMPIERTRTGRESGWKVFSPR